MYKYDEKVAIEEIKEMPFEARMYLKHIYRNGLQCIIGQVEMKQYESVKDEIFSLSEKLRGMGL